MDYLEGAVTEMVSLEPTDLTPLYELLTEIRGIKESVQYMHLAQLGLTALVIGLMLVLIFSTVWGRH